MYLLSYTVHYDDCTFIYHRLTSVHNDTTYLFCYYFHILLWSRHVSTVKYCIYSLCIKLQNMLCDTPWCHVVQAHCWNITRQLPPLVMETACNSLQAWSENKIAQVNMKQMQDRLCAHYTVFQFQNDTLVKICQALSQSELMHRGH